MHQKPFVETLGEISSRVWNVHAIIKCVSKSWLLNSGKWAADELHQLTTLNYKIEQLIPWFLQYLLLEFCGLLENSRYNGVLKSASRLEWNWNWNCSAAAPEGAHCKEDWTAKLWCVQCWTSTAAVVLVSILHMPQIPSKFAFVLLLEKSGCRVHANTVDSFVAPFSTDFQATFLRLSRSTVTLIDLCGGSTPFVTIIK